MSEKLFRPLEAGFDDDDDDDEYDDDGDDDDGDEDDDGVSIIIPLIKCNTFLTASSISVLCQCILALPTPVTTFRPTPSSSPQTLRMFVNVLLLQCCNVDMNDIQIAAEAISGVPQVP